MRVLGFDFTSSPRRSKPITCAVCTLDDKILQFIELKRLHTFDAFSETLRSSGPWIAGIDFPFGQSAIFIRNVGWPTKWADYVRYAEELGRAGFEKALRAYSASRSAGQPQLHRRVTDVSAKSLSPQKLDFVPVAKIFFEGAPRLIASGVTIPILQEGDPNRIVVEAYPKLLAQAFIPGTSSTSPTIEKNRPRLGTTHAECC